MSLSGYDSWKCATPDSYSERDTTDADAERAELAEAQDLHAQLVTALHDLVAFASSCHASLVYQGHRPNGEPPQITAALAALAKAEGNKP